MLLQLLPGVHDHLAAALERQLAREEMGLADRVGDRDLNLVLAGGQGDTRWPGRSWITAFPLDRHFHLRIIDLDHQLPAIRGDADDCAAEE